MRKIKVRHLKTESVISEVEIPDEDGKFFFRETPWPDDYREIYYLRSDIPTPKKYSHLVSADSSQ